MMLAKTFAIVAMAATSLATDATASTGAETVVLHCQKTEPEVRNEATGEHREIDRSVKPVSGKPLPTRPAGAEKNHGHRCGNKFQLPTLPADGTTVTPNADAVAQTSTNAGAAAAEHKAESKKLDAEATEVETRRAKTNADNSVTTVENEVKVVESAVAAICGQRPVPTDPQQPVPDLKKVVSDIFAGRPTTQVGATWTARTHETFTRPTGTVEVPTITARTITGRTGTPESRTGTPESRTGTPESRTGTPESRTPESRTATIRSGSGGPGNGSVPPPMRKRSDGADANADSNAEEDDKDEAEQEDDEIETARKQFMGGDFGARGNVADPATLMTACNKLRDARQGGQGGQGGQSGSPAPAPKNKRDQGATDPAKAEEEADEPSKGEDDENTSTVNDLVGRLRAHCGVDFKTSADADVAGAGAVIDQACKDAAARIAGAIGDFQKSKDLGDRQKCVKTEKDEADETATKADQIKADADKCKTFIASNADLSKANADLKAAHEDAACKNANTVCEKKASGKHGSAKVEGDNTAEAPVPAADAGLTTSEQNDVAACKAKLEAARDAVKAALAKTDGQWKANCGEHLGWQKQCRRRRAIKACFRVSNALPADATIADEVEVVKAAWKAKHRELCDEPTAQDKAACAAAKDSIENAQVEKPVDEAPEPTKDVDGMQLRDAKACVSMPEPSTATSTQNRKRADAMLDTVVTKMITNPASTTTTCTGLKFVNEPVPSGVPAQSDVTTYDAAQPVDRIIVDQHHASSGAVSVVVSATAALIGFAALFF